MVFEEIRLRFNDDGCTRLQAGNTLSLDLQSPDRDKGTKSGNITDLSDLANLTSTSTICCSHHRSRRVSCTHVIGIGFD